MTKGSQKKKGAIACKSSKPSKGPGSASLSYPSKVQKLTSEEISKRMKRSKNHLLQKVVDELFELAAVAKNKKKRSKKKNDNGDSGDSDTIVPLKEHYDTILDLYSPICPFITRSILTRRVNYRLNKKTTTTTITNQMLPTGKEAQTDSSCNTVASGKDHSPYVGRLKQNNYQPKITLVTATRVQVEKSGSSLKSTNPSQSQLSLHSSSISREPLPLSMPLTQPKNETADSKIDRKPKTTQKQVPTKFNPHMSQFIALAKNEIASLFRAEMEQSKLDNTKISAIQIYRRVHEDVKLKRKLPDSFSFSYDAVRARVKRNVVFKLTI